MTEPLLLDRPLGGIPPEFDAPFLRDITVRPIGLNAASRYQVFAGFRELFATPIRGPDEEALRLDDARLIAMMRDLPAIADALRAAVMALRSYQHGNAAPDLAQEIADAGEAALAKLSAR